MEAVREEGVAGEPLAASLVHQAFQLGDAANLPVQVAEREADDFATP